MAAPGQRCRAALEASPASACAASRSRSHGGTLRLCTPQGADVNAHATRAGTDVHALAFTMFHAGAEDVQGVEEEGRAEEEDGMVVEEEEEKEVLLFSQRRMELERAVQRSPVSWKYPKFMKQVSFVIRM